MQESRDALAMDIKFSPPNAPEQQDILTDAGFSNMLYQVLRLKPGGNLWTAPVCSTWGYMPPSWLLLKTFSCFNFLLHSPELPHILSTCFNGLLNILVGGFVSKSLENLSHSRSRGSTLRTAANPMGHGHGVTGQHNIMVGRVCILLALAMAKQVWWCMEQPKGSLLEGHTLFQKLLRLKHVAVTKVTCSLGWFGADTLKPIWVYSSNLL